MDFAIEVAALRSGLGARLTGSGVKMTDGAATFRVLMGAADPACPLRNAKVLIYKM
jgi:hypothetical protein